MPLAFRLKIGVSYIYWLYSWIIRFQLESNSWIVLYILPTIVHPILRWLFRQLCIYKITYHWTCEFGTIYKNWFPSNWWPFIYIFFFNIMSTVQWLSIPVIDEQNVMISCSKDLVPEGTGLGPVYWYIYTYLWWYRWYTQAFNTIIPIW